jgi:hypothetical protein
MPAEHEKRAARVLKNEQASLLPPGAGNASTACSSQDIEDEQALLSPDRPARLRIAGQICEGQVLEGSSARRDVQVTVIRGGASINGYYYNQDALVAIADLLENAQAYVDHASNGAPGNPVRSVRDVAGFYREAVYVPPDENTPGGRVEATLHILESADWLWSTVGICYRV